MIPDMRHIVRVGVLGFAGLSGPLLTGCAKEAIDPTIPKVQEITSLNLRDGDVQSLQNDLYLFNPSKSPAQAMEFPEKLRTFVKLHPELRICSISPGDPEPSTFEGYQSGPVSLTFLVAVEPRDPNSRERDRVLTFAPTNFANNLKAFIDDNPDYGIGPSAPTAPRFKVVGGKSKSIQFKETGFVVVVRDRAGLPPLIRE